MKITPLILGSGRSGEAIAKSIASLGVLEPDLGLQAPTWLTRGASLSEAAGAYESPVLFIANPHGLHAGAILEAERAGFRAILCEKPSCVSLEEVGQLRDVSASVAVFHVYRQLWGPQALKSMLVAGDLGELITIEGRYWQSSAAERALRAGSAASVKSWKNEPALSGPFDAFLDVASHWVDLVCYLQGSMPTRISGWRSYANAEAPHRDTHVQLAMDFTGGRAFGSVSKTFHGANQRLEIHLAGTRGSATWNLLSPDEIVVGEGRDQRVLTRKASEQGSRHAPFHGMGWVEGYIEITRRLLREAFLGEVSEYPRLGESLRVIEAMLSTHWNE